MKTEMEKMIETQYQNCHIPVLCKNKSYADAATGRKVDPKIAEEKGKVKFLADAMQYVNQKLDKPIYHEFIWIENRVIHHKVIRAFRINKHGMDWEEVYHAKFYTESTNVEVEGECTPEYWLSDESDLLFVEETHNWIGIDGREVIDVDDGDESNRIAEFHANDKDARPYHIPLESYYKVVLQGYVDMKLEIEYLDKGILRTEEIIQGGDLED